MYFDQFNVVKLITIQVFLGEVSFTNSSMMMVLGVTLFLLLLEGNKLISNRWQFILEFIYINIQSVVQDNLGNLGQKFFPFVLCLFIFIAMLNILGLFPYVFVPMAQIVITLGISLTIIMAVTLLGILNFKLNFLSILMPGGVPLVLAPFLVVIETISYLIRAISLGVRLVANISAGHLLFAILSGFAFNVIQRDDNFKFFTNVDNDIYNIIGNNGSSNQAYVFCLLTTIYLGDTIALH